MRSRPVFSISAAVAVMLTLALSACSAKVEGSPIAAANASGIEKSTTSSKKTTSVPKTTKDRNPTTTTSQKGKPAGNIKITQKKKTDGYEDCDLLTPQEVADAVGGKNSGEKGCVQSTENPFAVVLFMVTFAEYEGEATPIEVGGNTAYQVKEEFGDCSVIVMLTDDLEEITPAFLASVTPVDKIDPCTAALKLAAKAFEKIPNA